MADNKQEPDIEAKDGLVTIDGVPILVEDADWDTTDEELREMAARSKDTERGDSE